MQRSHPVGRQRVGLHHRLHQRRRGLRGDQGAADGHRLEHLHDLRRNGAHHHGGVLGLRQRRHRRRPSPPRPTCSTTATSASPVLGSPYATSCGGAVDPNYAFSYFGGSVTVNTAPADHHGRQPDHDLRRDGADHLRRSTRGSRTATRRRRMSTPPTCSTTATSSSTVAGSPYQTFCSGAADSNYTIGYATGALTVGKAPLTVTALSTTMTYGGTVPTITPNYSGFVNGDTPVVADHAAHLLDHGHELEHGGGLPLSLLVHRSGGPELHHRVRERIGDGGQGPSHHHRARAVPWRTAAPCRRSRPATRASSTATRPRRSRRTRRVRRRPTAPAPSRAARTPSSCSGAVDSNYAITYVAGSVTVTPAPLTITASSTSMTYGGTRCRRSRPPTRASSTATPPRRSRRSRRARPTATSSSAVSGSPYASSCSGAVDPNYTIAYVNGSVTVTTAPLTITPQASTMTYGGTVPTITPGYSGFVNGDTPSSLTTPPTCSTTATSSDPPSPPTYASSCSGASDPNYTIAYDPGATTVTPAPIPVAVSGSQANQGAPSFVGTATQPPPSGVTVDTTGVTCSQVLPSTNISGALPSGSYTLLAGSCSGATLSGADASDYAPTYTSATDDFTVTGGPGDDHRRPRPRPRRRATGAHVRLLVGRLRRRHLHLRFGPVLRLDREHQVAATRGRHQPDRRQGRLLAGGLRRRHLRLRRRRVLRLHTRGRAVTRRIRPPAQPERADRRHGPVVRRGRLLHGGLRRRRLRLRRCPVRGLVPGYGRLLRVPRCRSCPTPPATATGWSRRPGNVYAFGDAPVLRRARESGLPCHVSRPHRRRAAATGSSSPTAPSTPTGTPCRRGGPVGSVGGLDPASTIFSDADGGGYWVASADGAVFPYGDAPNDGSMAGSHLNGSIIAATGF